MFTELSSSLTTSVKAAPRAGRPSAKQTMLDAAQAVVLEQGAGRLTLDAVARKAGASKGGVMYHFPTKQALLSALGERMIARNQQRHAEFMRELPMTPSGLLTAHVQNSTSAADSDDRTNTALLAVLHGAPELADAARSYFKTLFGQLTKGADFEHVALIYLASEGLWLLEMLNLLPLNKPQRALMSQRLLQMAAASPAVRRKSAKKTGTVAAAMPASTARKSTKTRSSRK